MRCSDHAPHFPTWRPWRAGKNKNSNCWLHIFTRISLCEKVTFLGSRSVFPNFRTVATNASSSHDAGFGTDVTSPATSTITADKLIIRDKRDVIRKTAMVKTTYGEVSPITCTSFCLVFSDEAVLPTCNITSRTSRGTVLSSPCLRRVLSKLHLFTFLCLCRKIQLTEGAKSFDISHLDISHFCVLYSLRIWCVKAFRFWPVSRRAQLMTEAGDKTGRRNNEADARHSPSLSLTNSFDCLFCDVIGHLENGPAAYQHICASTPQTRHTGLNKSKMCSYAGPRTGST